MTFENLLNEAAELCHSAAEDKSISSDDSAIKEKIRQIAESIENKCRDIEDRIDSRTRSLLFDLIDTGKGSSGVGYDSFAEMLAKLSCVRIAYSLNGELKKYEDEFNIYSYEYAADQPRFLNYTKACSGLMYVIESRNDKKENAILFTNDELIFIRFKANGIFQIADKLKISYDSIIGVCQGYESDGEHEYLDIVSGTYGDESTWTYDSFEIGSMDDGIICDIVDSVIAGARGFDSEEETADYYSKCCKREYDMPIHKLKVSLADQWKIITILGEKAHQISENECKDILLTIYQRQKTRAALDNNKKLESLSRRRLLILTGSIENQDRVRVMISKKRQITIPESIYEAMDFKDEAELVYEDGRLYINPKVTKTEDDASEILLEELVSHGLSGDELVKYFKLGVVPEQEESENDEADAYDESESINKTSDASDETEKKEKKTRKRVNRRKNSSSEDSDEEDPDKIY